MYSITYSAAGVYSSSTNYYLEENDLDYLPRQATKGDACGDLRACLLSSEYQPFTDEVLQSLTEETRLFGKKLFIDGVIHDQGYSIANALRLTTGALPKALIIDPDDCKLIPAGFKVALPSPKDGMTAVMKLYPRSGLATKCGLVLANGVGIVDCGYRGDVKVALKNTGNSINIITHKARIAQCALETVIDLGTDTSRGNWIEDKDLSSDRGAGGFGSTGATNVRP
jgi:dUTP pyrophosphatase